MERNLGLNKCKSSLRLGLFICVYCLSIRFFKFTVIILVKVKGPNSTNIRQNTLLDRLFISRRF